MKAFAVLAAVATLASSVQAFVPAAPAPAARKAATTPRMALNVELTKTYPRDFKNIPLGTNYGGWVLGWVGGTGARFAGGRSMCDLYCRVKRCIKLQAANSLTQHVHTSPGVKRNRQGPGRRAEQGD